MIYKTQRLTVDEKYNVKEVLYALRELYDALKNMQGNRFEITGLKRAMTIIRKDLPRLPKDGRCPNCAHEVDNFFCPECGQAIYRNHRTRPIDEHRHTREYDHKPIEYFGIKQRREIDEYIRTMGLEWVLDKLARAERDNDPIDKNEIRDMALESEEERKMLMNPNVSHKNWRKVREENGQNE